MAEQTEDQAAATEAAPPRKPRAVRAPAAETAAPKVAAPCADCQEREQSLEERLDALESAHRSLAKGFITLAVAAVVVYVLAGREKAGEVTG